MPALEKSDKTIREVTASAQEFAFKPGNRLRIGGEPYKVIKPIGAGGVGDVYLVEHMKTQQKYAMKHLYHNFATNPEKYYGKLRLLSSHKSPHPYFVWPIALSSFDQTSRSFCYVMPLVEEDYLPLSDAIINPSLLTLQQKLIICKKLAEAFSRLRELNWVYGDCSANNFLFKICPGGEPDVKIFDCDTITRENCAFGLSGTGRYRAPEVLLGKGLTLNSDAHALASVLFHFLIGCNPLDGAYSSSVPLSVESVLQFYGREPIFIFDPEGKNPPLHPILDSRFAALPNGLQAYFRLMFSNSRLTGKAPRPGPDVLLKVLSN